MLFFLLGTLYDICNDHTRFYATRFSPILLGYIF